MPRTVRVTYDRTGHTFTSAVDRHGMAANGTLSCVKLHDDGTASHVGNGMVVAPDACATWTAVGA